jgi:hypothetical protein
MNDQTPRVETQICATLENAELDGETIFNQTAKPVLHLVSLHPEATDEYRFRMYSAFIGSAIGEMAGLVGAKPTELFLLAALKLVHSYATSLQESSHAVSHH